MVRRRAPVESSDSDDDAVDPVEEAKQEERDAQHATTVAEARLQAATSRQVADKNEQKASRISQSVTFQSEIVNQALEEVRGDLEENRFGQSHRATVALQERVAMAQELVEETKKMKHSLAQKKPSIEELLGIDGQQMVDVASILRTIQVAKILYLLVITGCELDLDGFGLACATYWHAGETADPETNFVMRALLCIGPAGYLLSIVLYLLSVTCGVGEKIWMRVSRQRRNLARNVQGGDAHLPETLIERIDPRAEENIQIRGDAPIHTHNQFPLATTKQAVHIKMFHFLPVLRYFLLVKDTEPSDIEALFRVNALSTFTLGFAQVFCMLLGFGNGSLHWEVKTVVGVVAQVVNLSMTYLYFFTRYPERMKRAMSVEAFQFNQVAGMATEFERYTFASQQCSLNFGTEDPTNMRSDHMNDEQRRLWTEKQHYRDKCVRDINEKAQTNIADVLHLYSTEQLFTWRRRLVEKQVSSYCDDSLVEKSIPAWQKAVGCLACLVLCYSILKRWEAISQFISQWL